MIIVNARFLTKKVTGLERYASELTTALKKLNPAIKFVTHKGVLNSDLTKELNVEVFGILKGHLWEQIELPIYLRGKGNPILLNPVNTGPIYYKNQFTIIHDLAFLRHPEWYSRRAAVIFKFIVNRVTKNSKHIFTVSEFSNREIVELLNIPDEKITVIYGAVPEKIKELSVNEYDNKYGNYILTVSTLEPRKNLLNMIKGFLQLQNEDMKLVIIGQENRRVFSDAGISKIKKSNIIFTGYISDEELVGLYKNAKLFVFPSRYEGLGFPPLEALYCNSDLIVSDIKPLKEILKNRAGYFKPNSPNDIAEKIDNFLGGEKLLKKNNAEKSFELLSWTDIAKKLVKILEE